MEFTEFKQKPQFDAKAFVINGDEEFYKFLAKNILTKKFAGREIVYVHTEMLAADFYEKIEPNEIIPEPKLIFVDNTEGDLAKYKNFWTVVGRSSPDIHYVVDTCKIPKDASALEIKCSKMKDSAKEVNAFVEEMSKAMGFYIDRKNVPFFYHLYRNNLFLIYNELKKCQLWSSFTGVKELDYGTLKKFLSPASDKDVFSLSNNFLKRKLKAAFLDLDGITDSDAPLQLFNLFKGVERLLVYKTAVADGLDDNEISQLYELNQYYIRFTLKEVAPLWSVEDLKDVLLEIESVTINMKTFAYPTAKGIVKLVLRYCG